MASDVRQAIAERISGIAAWRRERELQDLMGLGPEVSARSRRSADGLEDLARAIVGLPADDPRLTRISMFAFVGEHFDPGATMLHELGRFRFHDPEATIEGFIDRMVELAELDHSERGDFGGPQVPGDNPWRPGWLPPPDDEDEW